MRNNKIQTMLGFARKSGNLVMGYHTCIFTMKKKKLRLLLIAEDISENTREKIEREAKKWQVLYRFYGSSETLSHAAGTEGRAIFGITDRNFANVILKEIDQGE